MSNQKDVIYAIIINMMLEENLVFNEDIAKETYGWSRATFYNFLAFIKRIKCFIVVKEQTGYALKNKGFSSGVFDEEKSNERGSGEEMFSGGEF